MGCGQIAARYQIVRVPVCCECGKAVVSTVGEWRHADPNDLAESALRSVLEATWPKADADAVAYRYGRYSDEYARVTAGREQAAREGARAVLLALAATEITP